MRPPVRKVFSYGIRHGIRHIHCDSMKYDLMLHWITMNMPYTVPYPVWKCLPYGSVHSPYYLNSSSHLLLEQNLSVARSLLYDAESIIIHNIISEEDPICGQSQHNFLLKTLVRLAKYVQCEQFTCVVWTFKLLYHIKNWSSSDLH